MNEIQNVNLLNCDYEPSDSALSALMKATGIEARRKAAIANSRLMTVMAKDAEAVRNLYNITSASAPSP